MLLFIYYSINRPAWQAHVFVVEACKRAGLSPCFVGGVPIYIMKHYIYYCYHVNASVEYNNLNSAHVKFC